MKGRRGGHEWMSGWRGREQEREKDAERPRKTTKQKCCVRSWEDLRGQLPRAESYRGWGVCSDNTSRKWRRTHDEPVGRLLANEDLRREHMGKRLLVA